MEDFVSFEIAKKLKDRWFREECLLHYTDTGNLLSNSIDTYDRPNQELDYSDFKKCFNNGNSIGLVDAPTISQVLEWLRKEKKIHIGFGYSPRKKWRYVVMYMDDRFYNRPTLAVDGFLKLKQAAFAGIEYVLDNLM